MIKTEMYHRKNLDASVALLSDAVSRLSNLTEVDKLDMLERAEMLARRKSDISQDAKTTVKLILNDDLSQARLKSEIETVTIRGILCR